MGVSVPVELSAPSLERPLAAELDLERSQTVGARHRRCIFVATRTPNGLF